jgi:hypothetical protein
MLSSNGPIPVSATIATGTGAWSCTFDQSLQPGVLNAANWDIIAGGLTWNVTSASASGNVVSGASVSVLPSPDPTGIDFAPPPFDVENAIGQTASAFSGFPIVVT